MKVERERGISVTASVMSFDYAERSFNLVDTPGHEDFPRIPTARSPPSIARSW